MKKIIFGTIFISLAILAFWSFSYAQTESELRNQINTATSEIEKINKEIAALSGQIAITAEQKKTLATAIKDLTLKKDKLVTERKLTEKKISATGLVIKTLNNEIGTKDNILNKHKESLSSLLRNLYQQDQENFVSKLLSQEKLSDMSREYNDVIELNEQIKNKKGGRARCFKYSQEKFNC